MNAWTVTLGFRGGRADDVDEGAGFDADSVVGCEVFPQDTSFFVENEDGGSSDVFSHQTVLVTEAEGIDHLEVWIGEDGVGEVKFGHDLGIGLRGIDTDADNVRLECLEIVVARLQALQF